MDTSDLHAPSATGPGKTLRQARLDLRLSPEDVAAQLHLAARQIVALENDDYANLPQATYVRGYLRNYALLLGLTPDPILDSYSRLTASNKPQRIGLESGARPREDRDAQVRSASLIVGALVVVLAIAWWQGRDDFENTTPAQTPPAEVAQAPATDSSAIPPPATTPPPAVAPADAVPMPPPADRVRPPVATPPPAAKPVTPPTKPVPSNLPRSRIVINADQESWVDIRDAQQNRLVYETVPAGRVVALEGVPPFSVFLGNVDGVTVSIDGQAYDARKHKRGTTARFNIGRQKPAAAPSEAPAPRPEVAPQTTPPAPTAAPTPTTPPPTTSPASPPVAPTDSGNGT